MVAPFFGYIAHEVLLQMEKYFFDLPVYRLTKSKYYKWRDETQIRPHEENWLSVRGRPMPQESKNALDQHVYEKYGPWEFNEIIGYIRLYFLGSQIRGDYLSAEKSGIQLVVEGCSLIEL
ncbi:hypothetical protein [Pseudophaeobacter arcticus]